MEEPMGEQRRLAGFELFGSLTSIGEVEGAVSFLIIVLVVLLFETLSEIASERARFTRWENIVTSIKDELMIVGAIAFILRCVVFSIDYIDADWLHAIEFACLVVPITAFFFVIQGFGFVSLAWAEERHLVALYDPSPQGSALASYYSYEAELEFKFAKYVFCEHYQIPTQAFDYGAYLGKVCEKHIAGVMGIEVGNWLAILLVIMLNWARIAMGVLNSKDACEKGDYACAQLGDAKLFTGCGFLVFFATGLLAGCTRWYTTRALVAHQVADFRDADDTPHTVIARLLEHRRTTAPPHVSRTDLPTMRGMARNRRTINSPRPFWQTNKASGFYSESMRAVFLFGRPELYFSMIDNVLMLISFYMSLWVVNFAYSTDDFKEPARAGWKVLTLVPGLASMLVFLYVVRASYLLKGVTYLDDGVVIEMVEERKELVQKRDLIKELILTELVKPHRSASQVTSEEGRAMLKAVFEVLDTDKSQTLDKAELRGYLENHLGLMFSKKLWHTFFHCVDRDGSGAVDLAELSGFLFNDDL